MTSPVVPSLAEIQTHDNAFYTSQNTHDQINQTASSAQLVKAALIEHISSIDPNACDGDEENSFFVVDLGEVYRQHIRWKSNLERVKPHYGRCLALLMS